ncbi:hypothetical protein LTR27_002119 [Elasticomyces elasticus]|nr:hypothetical protein LTR27_002119 [Elasticomyces elasticus]
MSTIPYQPAYQSFHPGRSMHPAYQQAAVSPRPLYFISRDTGIMVPLVPADELPFNVRLAGVPRVMQIEETFGMQHIGMAPYSGMVYNLERDIHTGVKIPDAATSQPTHSFTATPGSNFPPGGHARTQSSTPVKYLAPDAHARQALAQSALNSTAPYNSNGTTSSRPVSAHETATSWRSSFNPTSAPAEPMPIKSMPTAQGKPTDATQSIIDAILATTSGAQEASRLGYVNKNGIPPPPSGTQPDSEKKEFCTFWIRTGECDYMQQGCLYKHEMPDRATLEKIGFRGVPRWWQEKQGAMSRAPGEKLATVGEVVKSSVWLKKFGKKESDEESEVGSVQSKSSKDDGEVEQTNRVAAEPITPDQKKSVMMVKTIDQPPKPALRPRRPAMPHTKSSNDVEKHSSTPAIAEKVVNTRAVTPTATEMRKASTTSDLIDFAMPLLPTPSPSSTPSLTTASSVESSPRQGHITPKTPPTTPEQHQFEIVTKPATKPASKAAKIFVPKGESPDHHIAEARKREARQYARRGAPVSTVGKVMPLERQIQEMQKVKAGTKQPHEERKNAKVEISDRTETGNGLMASRHAPPKSDGPRTAIEQKTERHQLSKTASMRIRRAVGTTKSAERAPVTILKKEKSIVGGR